jgi:hypothetical protein
MLSWTKESVRNEPVRIVQDVIKGAHKRRASQRHSQRSWGIAFGSAKQTTMGKFSPALRRL